jgi:hypothetical protein
MSKLWIIGNCKSKSVIIYQLINLNNLVIAITVEPVHNLKLFKYGFLMHVNF